MRVLVCGATGQLARALLTSVPPSIEVVGVGRSELELTDTAAVERCIERIKPAVVINATAYTAVDKAESDRELAFAINDAAVNALATASSRRGLRFVHISTDFVFDGKSSHPYRINDDPNPLSVYGESKLAGERRITSVPNLNFCIVRTAWVYSPVGRNFVLTMLKLFRERDRVQVVADQIGTPTSAKSLASFVWKAALSDYRGLLHFTDAGVASWYDFAVAIYEEALALKLVERSVAIEPITTEQYPTPARRPAYSVLDKTESWQALSVTPRHWRAELRDVLRELKA